ncbi:MAG TPA: hypothetical protein VEL07_04315 [Planctomycetota bacterium]|nr:hypothetical protein [Planctomycetota bacterium]
MRIAPIATLILTCAAAASAAVIDADPGNFRTKLTTLAAGDTLRLAAGTYTRSLAIDRLQGRADAWITIAGPTSGARAVFLANESANTVEITWSSYVAIENLVLDGQHLAGPFGVSAKNGLANLVHHIRVENCEIRDYDGNQQTVGISTKTPTWGWIVRGNRILEAGTGMYFGNSDGSMPFIDGVIEGNLVRNPIGYAVQVKHQTDRPALAGMPTGPCRTIFRHNVLLKDARPSPDGDRPNLLLGGFPAAGAGSSDRYEVYGNLLHGNPRESLLQAEGRVAIHDNVFVAVAGTAILLRQQNTPLRLAHVYHNTIHAAGRGIHLGTAATEASIVVGNLVFATTPISGAIGTASGNLIDAVANAGAYVTAPSTALGAMDLYPRPGECTGPAVDLAPFAGQVDANRDFNGVGKGDRTFRGAYAGSGVNPGWRLAAEAKPIPSGTVPGGPGGGTGGGATGGGATGGSSGSAGGSGGSGGGCGAGGGLAAVAAGLALAAAAAARRT